MMSCRTEARLTSGIQTDRSELPCGERSVTGMSINGMLDSMTETKTVGGDQRGCERGRHGHLHDGCSTRTAWRGWGVGDISGRRASRQGWRYGNGPCPERGGQGRWIVNVLDMALSENGWMALWEDLGWAAAACSSPHTPEPLGSELRAPWASGTVRLCLRCVHDEACFLWSSSFAILTVSASCYVPYSAREGPERAERAKRAKGYPIRAGAQIGNFVGRFLLPPGTLESIVCRLGVHTEQEVVRELVDQDGFDWRLAHPFWYSTISSIKFILRGQYIRRDGRHIGVGARRRCV
ncbi:hypothetical protein B0H63DRAFT_109869 [Podospora didyma]|uniref:Uncharacterized protein n=1 Tax=Podospora didyma TaxID=330526 RepID=A0AAE0NZ44_9PEZI|nr:hypothetical protein B0H63DRAFT_109869 [Podospora didyma]